MRRHTSPTRHAIGLRAGDALHLAICADHGATLCTLDRRLGDAGPLVGVRTWSAGLVDTVRIGADEACGLPTSLAKLAPTDRLEGNPMATNGRTTSDPTSISAWPAKPGAGGWCIPGSTAWPTAATNGSRCSTACPRRRRCAPWRCIRCNPEIVYAGTQSGPYRSADRGEHWEKVDIARPRPAGLVDPVPPARSRRDLHRLRELRDLPQRRCRRALDPPAGQRALPRDHHRTRRQPGEARADAGRQRQRAGPPVRRDRGRRHASAPPTAASTGRI